MYGVDHGVTFSPVPKLRTVLWAWRGQPFTDEELAVLVGLRLGLDGSLGTELRELLDPIEVAATARRVDRLVEAGVFPQPDPRWPALPGPRSEAEGIWIRAGPGAGRSASAGGPVRAPRAVRSVSAGGRPCPRRHRPESPGLRDWRLGFSSRCGTRSCGPNPTGSELSSAAQLPI